MRVGKHLFRAAVISTFTLVAVSLDPSPLAGETLGLPEGDSQTPPDNGRRVPVCEPSALDSPYIPVDSWVYSAVFQLYGLGYIDTVFLNMRPWTRASLEHVLEQAGARIEDAQDYPDAALIEAQEIYGALDRELHPDMQGPCRAFRGKARIESVLLAYKESLLRSTTFYTNMRHRSELKASDSISLSTPSPLNSTIAPRSP